MDKSTIKTNKFNRSDGESFWDFLESAKIEYRREDFGFLTADDVPVLRPVLDFGKFLKITSRGEALAYLYEGLGRTLVYVGPVLDKELKHGFNDHTDRHTLWVTQTGWDLLARSGMSFDGKDAHDSKTDVLMTLVGMTHDLGNLVGRKNHSHYSLWMMSRIFYNYRNYPEEWKATLKTIKFHDEEAIKEANVDLRRAIPLLCALVAADKMHVGRDRIGEKSLLDGVEKGAIEHDVHILLNSLITRSTWYLSPKTFVWHLDFSVEQLAKKFASFTNGKDRLWVSKAFIRDYKKRGIAFRESFAKEFGRVYSDRIFFTSQSVFRLLPAVKTFKVVLVDNDTRGKVGDSEFEVVRVERAANKVK